MTEHINISAVLHTYNEEAHLEECLKSVRWCDEVLVIDLGSKDRSVEIAEKYADRVLHHEWVPVVEHVKNWSYAQAKNDWILVLDPDEVYPPQVEQQIRKKVYEASATAAFIRIPMQYYFRQKPLKCCIWYPHMRQAIINRNRLSNRGHVHDGGDVCGDVFDIEWGAMDPIRHYWKDSWKQFITSHWRYIKHEGVARYNQGRRFGLGLMLKAVWRMVYLNLIDKKGYQGGFDGILLSFAMGVYEAGSYFYLFKYQWDLKHDKIR